MEKTAKGPASDRTQQAVIYARVSSKPQEEKGFSIPAQLDLLRGYAGEIGFTVVKEFRDSETAKQIGRAGFGEMLKFLRATPSCRILIVEKEDRLARNFEDAVALGAINGLQIHYAKERRVISADSPASEVLMQDINLAIAKHFSRNLSGEVKKGMTRRAMDGLLPGKAPLGYKNVEGASGKRVVEVDPETGPLVKRLFREYSSGRYSIHEITKMAKEWGLRSRRSSGTLAKTTVHRTLQDPFYVGQLRWKNNVYPGAHEALVTLPVWERVQQVLDRNFKTKTHRIKHSFTFSRLIRCGHCGCSVVGLLAKGRYLLYRCSGYKGKCGEPYVREEVLDQKFAELLKTLVVPEKVVEWFRQGLHEAHAEQKKVHDDVIEKLQTQYKLVEKRLDAAYEDKLDGKVSTDLYERKVAEWQAEQVRTLATIDERRQGKASYFKEGVLTLELAQDAHSLYLRQKSEEKRSLLGFLLSNSTWANGELSATFRQPFAFFAVTRTLVAEDEAAGVSLDDDRSVWRPTACRLRTRSCSGCARSRRCKVPGLHRFTMPRPSSTSHALRPTPTVVRTPFASSIRTSATTS